MVERFHHSLALRLAAVYALLFALSAAVLFGVLYVLLARSLDAREHEALERRAADWAAAYNAGGPGLLRARIDADNSPEVRSLFVRLLGSDGEATFAKVPPDWIEPQGERRLVPDGWGGWDAQEVHSVRVPRDAAHDFAVTSLQLFDGRLLQIARSTDSRAILLAPLRRTFTGVGAAALLFSVAGGTFLAYRATQPLRTISATTRRIVETGDLNARVPTLGGSGELATLVRQLNTLLDKNSAHVRVLRETLDNLAHDLRTPLTRLRGTAEIALQDSADPTEARVALADCINESDRVLHTLETLLDVSAAEAGVLKLNRDRLDLRSLIEQSADLYREVAEEKKITVRLDLPNAPVEVNADSVRLSQAINNLLDNALKYTPSGGSVTLAVRAAANKAVFTVTDNGPGVPIIERDAIWRRLYRGDSSRSQRGLGLGLSLVKAIVEAHGGLIAVDDAPGGGARFTGNLPLV
jgi:signal transduction histidine kinase